MKQDSAVVEAETLLQRERAGRLAAETALAAVQAELYETNVELQTLIVGLDQAVADRTAEMLAARDRAIASDNAKSAFLANMSHEIRTPLTSIIGFAELMLDKRRQTGVGRGEAMTSILRNARHLLDLISDILDLSKIEADGLELEVQDVSLPDLLADIESLMGPQSREKGLQFDVVPQLPLPQSVRGDAVRLKQIIVNFCSNALKFTQAGSIAIEAQFDPLSRRLDLSVSDTGVGMTESEIAKLFRPFVQADVSTTRRYGGTGLGLYISRRLAERMGARIDVRSIPGQGSCFTLCLDLPDDAQDTPLLREPSAFAAARRTLMADTEDWVPALSGRVLLAEDGVHNQRLIGALVEATGVELVIVNNGALAVEAALSGDQDLILMDIQMPVLDGVAATQTLRSAGYAGPIVAITANVMRSDIDRYYKSGFTDALGKPLNRRRLYAVLAQHLRPAEEQAEPSTDLDDKLDALVALLSADFRAELPARIASIESALARRDWPELRHLVHALKGLAGSVGYPELTRLAQPVEASIQASRFVEAELQCALLLEVARQAQGSQG
jgi:signal transduction histidine kinase/AmiR/NasT family two-component response regulator